MVRIVDGPCAGGELCDGCGRSPVLDAHVSWDSSEFVLLRTLHALRTGTEGTIVPGCE